jgi:hypothetical protein
VSYQVLGDRTVQGESLLEYRAAVGLNRLVGPLAEPGV